MISPDQSRHDRGVSSDPGFHAGDWDVYPLENRLVGSEGERTLEPKAMDLLEFMAARPGEVLARSQLLEEVWPDVVVGDETLSRAVSVLRSALGDDQRNPRYIETIPKRGYRFIAEVHFPTTQRSLPPSARTFTRRWARWVAALAAIAIVATIGFWGLRWRGGEDTRAEDPLLALPSGPTVAVLSFTNSSPDPEDEFFSDGLSEDIITGLSRFRDLFVIARNSTFRYKGQPVDVRDIARELGAHYVLEGSVRRAGTSIRVTAQLLDASDGTNLWAKTFDRELSASSIFEVQDEITEQVVATLANQHGVISRARFEQIRGRATDDLAAYECVLLAHAYYRDQWTPSEHERVRGCLERAVRDDPNYADAWAYLGALILDEIRYGYNARPEPLARALRAAQRAVAADPTSQNAHAVLAHAHFFRHERDRFIAAAERAIQLNPNAATVLAYLGESFVLIGEDERGIALLRRAAKLDPYHPTWYNFAFATYHYKRHEYAEALLAARKINIPGYFWPKLILAAIYGQLGRQEEARLAVEELLSLDPDFTLQIASEKLEIYNFSGEIEHWTEGLHKAGVPDESTE